MEEQAKDVLAQMMQRALDGVDAAVEFSQEQIPDVVQQLLTWHFVQSLIFFLVGVVILSVCAVVAIKTIPTKRKTSAVRREAREAYERGEKWTRHGGSGSVSSIEYDRVMRDGSTVDLFNVLFPAAIASIFGLVFVGCNIDWLKIWIAPKLYLLEYGASLVK